MASNAMTANPTNMKGRDDSASTQSRGYESQSHSRMDDLRQQAGKLNEDVREIAATGGKLATDQLDSLEKYIKGQPMKSLLIAASVGALFGFFFLRR